MSLSCFLAAGEKAKTCRHRRLGEIRNRAESPQKERGKGEEGGGGGSNARPHLWSRQLDARRAVQVNCCTLRR